jgi:hypothetical protein
LPVEAPVLPTSSSSSATSNNDIAIPAQSDSQGLDLNAIANPEELEKLGLEGLKLELKRRGMKCGGTLQERAQRIFSVKGLHVIPSNLLAGK